MWPEPESPGTNSHLGRGCGLSPSPPEQTRILGADAADPGVVSCARSVTHRWMRSLTCSSPPTARHAPHPNLLRPSDGPGLRVSSPARSVTHRWMRSLTCSSPPTARHARHPNLLRPSDGPGLRVSSPARSVTHRWMRSLTCSSPPTARHAPHPNLLRSSDRPGLRASSPARLAYVPTGTLASVLVASFGSARPASQSASSVRWIRARQ